MVRKIYQFIDYSLDALFYGHSLIQLGDVVDGKFSEIKVINRSHVKPEKSLVVPYPSASEGVNFEDGEFKKWYIGVCKDTKDLGILSKVAHLLLYKQMVIAAYTQYCELFGVPIRIGKIGSNRQGSEMAMMEMLKNMGTASYGLFDKDDVIEIHESSGKSGEVFENYLAYIDTSISKAIVGQTMTTDSGSSYSQANVHQNIFNTIIDLLIPRMVELGFGIEGYTFKFDNSEYISVKDKFDMVDKLLQRSFDVPEEYILNEFGIPVTKKEPVVMNAPDADDEESEGGDDTGKKPQPL
jgi:phage gp29-like protein